MKIVSLVSNISAEGCGKLERVGRFQTTSKRIRAAEYGLFIEKQWHLVDNASIFWHYVRVVSPQSVRCRLETGQDHCLHAVRIDGGTRFDLRQIYHVFAKGRDVMGFRKFVLPLGAASIAVTVLGASASADISDIVFHIRAETPDGSFAEYSARLGDGYRDEVAGTYDWGLTQPVNMMSSSGELIAQLGSARVFCRDDPQVDLNFSVFAGSVNTVFTITSPLLGFANLTGAVGRTSAGLVMSDLDGDGVTMTDWNGNSIFTSRYNGAAPGGTTFHNSFLGTYGTPVSGGTFSTDDNFPGGGNYVPVPGTISDMSSRFRFTLSPNDIASGTSVYEIIPIPAPSAMTLLGLSGILVARRRR
ncbi:MAG: hypothetical protein H7210_09180 [Pyrinomonadaceae bacterium]|nr:hypothetical protein [Phycisphaerales bacterium]